MRRINFGMILPSLVAMGMIPAGRTKTADSKAAKRKRSSAHPEMPEGGWPKSRQVLRAEARESQKDPARHRKAKGNRK